MLGCSVSFGNAMLLVVGLPVSPLAVFAAVEDETTSSTGRKLGSTLISFMRGTVVASFSTGSRTLLVFRGGHHTRLDGECVSTARMLR
jgi:hypothetical protein